MTTHSHKNPRSSAVHENVIIVEVVATVSNIHDETKCNEWPGNYLDNSMQVQSKSGVFFSFDSICLHLYYLFS